MNEFRVALPSFTEVDSKTNVGLSLDPLESFIYNWEPAGVESEQDFRKELTELVEHIVNCKIDSMKRYNIPF